MTHKEAKGHLRDFMRDNYTDERLAQLLAHAQQGKLIFNSCCCFIGIATADHTLRSDGAAFGVNHYDQAVELPGAWMAETAFRALWEPLADTQECDEIEGRNAVRRRILIPMVRAEIARRDRQSVIQRALSTGSADLAAKLITDHLAVSR